MTKHIANTPDFIPSRTAYVLDPEQPLLAHERELSAHVGVAPHQHPRGQLLWACEGVLRVITASTVWIVPPSHVVWIPGNTLHHIRTLTPAHVRTLTIDPSIPLFTDNAMCQVLLLTPLMRELILRLSNKATDLQADEYKRLARVAIDELGRLPCAAFSLPAGCDTRLRKLTAHLVLKPEENRTLPVLAKMTGASPRTLERLFMQETGLSFRQWRSRLKLLCAIERLSKGESSTCVAYALGYHSVSSFAAAFHASFGCSPQHFRRHN